MPHAVIDQIATVFPVDAEALKPDPKPQRSFEIIKEFSLNTSTHGIPGIARGQSWPNRLFWAIASTSFLGIMLYFIIKSILTFFTYPTQTSIDIVTRWPMLFPAVTLCNYFPLRYDQFIGPFLNYTNAMNWSNTTDTSSFSPEQAAYIRPFVLDMLGRDIDISPMLFPLSAMLISCSYNGESCTAANFTSFTSLKYGACYTFNAQPGKMSDRVLHNNSDDGDTGNFVLELYVHRHQYIPYAAQAAGIVAMIHDNDQLPDIEIEAMYLGTGQRHRLSERQKDFTFLPAPYTTCTTSIGPAMQALFDQYPQTAYSYSNTLCFDICLQKYIYARCGCVLFLTWNIRVIVPYGTNTLINASSCSILSDCPLTAVKAFTANTSILDDYCSDCQDECAYSEFVIKATSLTALLDYDLDGLKAFVDNSTIPPPTNWSQTWPTDIPASYVALEVVSETTRVEVYAQQATTGLVDLVSNIGGQTGLWIGISFLSLLEVVEMVYRLAHVGCCAAARKAQKRTGKYPINEKL